MSNNEQWLGEKEDRELDITEDGLEVREFSGNLQEVDPLEEREVRIMERFDELAERLDKIVAAVFPKEKE